ncbi:MAG: polysaccharide pyruvyl transferase family protein [Phycisphaerales bacterium]|nr:MAG: polysaccharide pyruvyl transferase family protein [Phycisphaerales bacterium]
MTTKPNEENKKMVVCVLGASFDTGNLGVNALAESTIKIILHRWPGAEIVLLGNSHQPEETSLTVAGRVVTVRAVPIRFSKNVFLPFHFLQFMLYRVLLFLLPGAKLRQKLLRRNEYCRTLYETDLAVDITGGDSFSDIYGMRRFVLGFLRKWLVLFYGKRFIMLPQTYGPFHRSITRFLAKRILRGAEAIYSRDQQGLDCIRGLLNGQGSDHVRFAPDIAFLLDPQAPSDPALVPDSDLRAHGSTVVGLNISGLLYNGGYTRDNMFGLKVDYRQMVREIADLLLAYEDVVLLLVPHVFPPDEIQVESDPLACREFFGDLKSTYEGRVFMAAGRYSHNEIKSVIGRCDFFLGSRMHACIAALSQHIPAVGLAYSKKFHGVFSAAGVEDHVVDLLACDHQAVLTAVRRLFENRARARAHLSEVVPQLQEQILALWS